MPVRKYRIHKQTLHNNKIRWACDTRFKKIIHKAAILKFVYENDIKERK